MDGREAGSPGLTAREIADALWLLTGGRASDPVPTTNEEDARLRGARRPARSADEQPPRSPESTRPGPPGPEMTTTGGMAAVGFDTAPLVGGSGKRGVPRLDQVTSARGVQHALRSFRQETPSADEWEFDEEATAVGAVLDQRWLPVYRPAAELRWDAVLVVDDSPSMALWQATVDSFARTLVKQAVFRNVHLRRFGEEPNGRIVVRGTGTRATPRSISEVVDPAGRRIVLVMTDGVSAMWRSGSAFRALRTWGSAHPVALVHVLSWPIVQRMGIEIHRLRLKSPVPGAPNSRLNWVPQSPAPGVFDDLEDAMPVCVLGLGPVDVERWARMTTSATTGADLAAILIPQAPVSPGPPDAERTPAVLVGLFRATASPEAFELATHLAAAPLDLEVMSFLRARLVTVSRTEHLTEFLGSPLVVDAKHSAGTGEPERVIFEFATGVREELLAFSRRTSTLRVRAAVHHHLAEELPVFRRILDGSSSEEAPGTRLLARQFFQAELAATRALSGPYTAAAAEIGRLLDGDLLREHSTSRSPVRPTGVDATSDRTATPSEPLRRGGHPSLSAGAATTGGRGGRPVASAHRAAPIFGGVPPRDPRFTGRDDLLRALDERLVPGIVTAAEPEVLHGPGGVGKSELAIEYVYRNQANFDVVWWIPAERTVKIANSLMELGLRLGLDVGIESNAAVQSVLDALKGQPRYNVPSNWLLVFDNARSPQAIEPYLPIGGPGRILVASRDPRWLSAARCLDVTVFQRAESVQLLCRRDPALSDVDADRLAQALGDLPLAVAQAAAWRIETGMPAGEYLDLLAEKQLELGDVTETLDYPQFVAAMWNLSLGELKRKNPSAFRLLQVCAFLAPEPINRTMFTYSRNITGVPNELSRVLRDRLRLNEAIRDANRFALVRVDHRTNSIELHRLVQAVLISQMSEDERVTMRNAAHLMLSENDPDGPEEPDNWPVYVDLSAHLSASNAYESDAEPVRSLLYNQVQFFYRWGDHKRSAELAERIYRIWLERLGEDHPETLRMGRWYGFMLWAQGRYAEATPLNLELLERHRRTFGEEHEETIQAIGQVAADKRAEGDFVGALELSKRSYDICVRYLGDEDPVTLNAAHNLGVNLRLVGDFTSAVKLDADTWDRRVQIYGQEHEVPLFTQVGLTLDKRELGNYREAAAEHEEIMRMYERLSVGRPLNPTWLRALRHFAVMRRKAGDHGGAMTAAETAYDGLRRRYDLDHPETLAAALARSIELRHLGRLEQAAQLSQDTLTRYGRTLGPHHPHTLSAAVNVAIVRRLMGDLEGARRQDEAALDGFLARLGDDHPSTLITRINLASDLHAVGEVQAAHDADAETLSRATAVFGAEHPTTLACRTNLAHDLRSLGRTDEAGLMRRRAVDLMRARLGSHHPAVTELSDPEARANCDIDPMPL
ncbi:FxSxx-COOH system tetratricopeptide repeat protein [Actinosynnema sp. NPDC050801]|uniref:FxSxx-COOH system tetratricopeptide repeat protein n=1 Tax=unclassified Actinosynnema TaxID=2637065 RepID=UPI0033DBE787